MSSFPTMLSLWGIFILSMIDIICWKSNYVVWKFETNAELCFVCGKVNFECADGC